MTIGLRKAVLAPALQLYLAITVGLFATAQESLFREPEVETNWLRLVQDRGVDQENGMLAQEDMDSGESTDFKFDPSSYGIGYDRGIYLRLRQEKDSFEIKANLRWQFRFVNFTRNTESWTNSAGVTLPVLDRRYFDIERARMILSGHAFDPSLIYYVQVDGDTDSAHVISIIEGWAGWQYAENHRILLGKGKVPAARNWILSMINTRMVDRSMANEYFRPNRTTGIFFEGDLNPATEYLFMIGQGYNTDGLTPQEVGDNFALAGSLTRDVIGDYGSNRPIDFEFHDELAVRLGISSVAAISGTPGRQSQEADFLRLTDGTRITEEGALVPGVRVESFNVFLLTFDAAYKYRGWSANGEYFIRSVSDLVPDMPVSLPDVGLQQGFYCEGGFFPIPKRLEFNSQYSFVTGDEGSSNTYATGFSYYPRNSHNQRLSVDGTYLDGSPTNSTGADIPVGGKGFLLRMEWQGYF